MPLVLVLKKPDLVFNPSFVNEYFEVGGTCFFLLILRWLAHFSGSWHISVISNASDLCFVKKMVYNISFVNEYLQVGSTFLY